MIRTLSFIGLVLGLFVLTLLIFWQGFDEILDLLEIATDSGTAVLMSTHNFPLIQPRKKRFIELNEGRLVTQ